MFHGNVIKGPWMRRYQVKFLSALSLLVIRQWGTGSCNTIITLPLALSAFKVVFAMHQGTVANTVIISAQEYASSLTQVKFMTNNSNDKAFVMYIVIGR